MCLAGTAVSVVAHHAFAAEFDANKPVKFTGTVTKMEWVNPHVWLHMDVKKPDGTVEAWAFEAGTPNVLFRRGFTKESLMPGTRGQGRRLPGEGRHAARERPRPDVRRRQEAVPGVVGHGRPVRAGAPGRRHDDKPQVARSSQRVTLRPGCSSASRDLVAVARARSLPPAILFTAGLLAFALYPPVRQNPRLLWSFLGTGAVLLAWTVVLLASALRTHRVLHAGDRAATAALRAGVRPHVDLSVLGLVLAAGLRLRAI